MSAPYPWLESAWQSLIAQDERNTLGHAYLLSGRAGLGKYDFAMRFIALMLCEARRADSSCGTCRGCTLLAAGNHPDFKAVEKDEERSRIVIEQVRELGEFFTLKAHYRARKVALIYPAELMNPQAANALLKLLEEPPAGALLLLVSHRPGQLLQTLQSRCQKIHLHTPDWDTCLAWLGEQSVGANLQLEGLTLAGAPLELKARLEHDSGPVWDGLIATLSAIAEQRQSVLQSATNNGGLDIREWLDALELIVQALVLTASGHLPQSLRLSVDSIGHLQKIANKLNSKRLFLYLDQIASARVAVLRSSGVREAEIVENLFYSWARLVHAEAKV